MGLLVMALLDVVHMTDEQRENRRERDEACWRVVEAYCAEGIVRGDAWTKAARRLRMDRRDVISGYWRHLKRQGKR